MFPDLSHGLVEGLGYAAGILTTLSFVPQVLKTWRTRSAGDLSATMLTVFTAGVVLWLVYGLALGSFPVILANGVTLVLTGVLLVLRLRRGR